jgi:hypothetical protein
LLNCLSAIENQPFLCAVEPETEAGVTTTKARQSAPPSASIDHSVAALWFHFAATLAMWPHTCGDKPLDWIRAVLPIGTQGFVDGTSLQSIDLVNNRSSNMKTTLIAAAVGLTLFAVPAFADCTGDMAKITEAMKTVKLDDAGNAKAKELMDKATVASGAKDEAACTAATGELMKLMGM